MKARGNFTVDMQWKDSRLTRVHITSNAGEPCRLRTARHVKVISKGEPVSVKKLGSFHPATRKGTEEKAL